MCLCALGTRGWQRKEGRDGQGIMDATTTRGEKPQSGSARGAKRCCDGTRTATGLAWGIWIRLYAGRLWPGRVEYQSSVRRRAESHAANVLCE